jgi:hypothetical protein
MKRKEAKEQAEREQQAKAERLMCGAWEMIAMVDYLVHNYVYAHGDAVWGWG